MPSRRLLGLVGILLLALGVRASAAVWWQSRLPSPRSFAFGDSDSYWRLAHALVRAEPYQYGGPDAKIMRMPGYPVVLAALLTVTGENPPVLWARFLGAAMGVLAVGLVMWIALEWFGERAMWWAGLMAALYPGAITSSIFILSEAPFCPLMLLQLLCWGQAANAGSGRERLAWAIAAGTAAGLAIYMRPAWLAFTPFAALAGLVLDSGRRVEQLQIVGVVLLVSSMLLSPWWLRSYWITGRFVATTLEMGASLYDGWNPDATGGSDMRFRRRFVRQQLEADRVTLPRGYFADRLDRRLRDAALAWARENPGKVLQLAAVKFVRLWNLWPNAASFSRPSLRLLWAAAYVPLLGLACVGVWRFASRPWAVGLLVLPAIFVTLLHLVFVSSIRYRQPPLLAMIPLAAACLALWLPPGRAAGGAPRPTDSPELPAAKEPAAASGTRV